MDEKNWVTPEVGGIYIDVMPDSETEGERFECVKITNKGKFDHVAFMMKRLKDGDIGRYNCFDWVSAE